MAHSSSSPDLELSDGGDEISLEHLIEDQKNVLDDAAADSSTPTIYNISSYGADLSAEQHAKRMKSGSYEIPPFQRSYVWTWKKASRFIESLLLGLPIPSLFLYKEEATGKHLIVDGHQRLKTIDNFYKGLFKNKKFALTDVHTKWNGRSYEELDELDRQNLDDAIIHTIIFKQDQPSEDKSSVYHVFERLNTGGMNLTSQEIRVCVSHGVFADSLSRMNANPDWRAIYGPTSPRMKDQELILRFLALLYESQHYDRPMVEFLNKFMTRHAAASIDTLDRFADEFGKAISIFRKSIGDRAFRPAAAINAAVYDSCMVGIARRLGSEPKIDFNRVHAAYLRLLDDSEFRRLYERATADKESVSGRLRLATNTFRDC